MNSFILLHTVLVTSFSRYKKYMMYYLLLFLQVLLVIICLGVNTSIPLLFCFLLKSRIFSTILTTFFRSSFSGIYFLITAFLKSIKLSLTLFTNCWFLACIALIKSFAKNDGFCYLKQFQNIWSFISFSSAVISFINSCCNFDLDLLCLVGCVAGSGVRSRVGILSKFLLEIICF